MMVMQSFTKEEWKEDEKGKKYEIREDDFLFRFHVGRDFFRKIKYKYKSTKKDCIQ